MSRNLDTLRVLCAAPWQLTSGRLWQRHRIVPAVYVFRILGVEVSNKFFAYILALQVSPRCRSGDTSVAWLGPHLRIAQWTSAHLTFLS
jgi:hypothetical protein